ncbi:unnamed protein product [Urochloa decumbens]|uniref:Uncharacterized protein n=1 Tax=Urochloa decumbens TaxID=240449 RepID=A0ABC9AG49_9POAL
MLGCQGDQKKRGEGTQMRNPSRQVGTVIRCRRCKGVGHNITSCGKRNGPPASVPLNTNAIVSTTQQSYSSANVGTSKRKRSSDVISASQAKGKYKGPTHKNVNVTKTSAMARVSTSAGGTASLKLHAQVPHKQARSSVTVKVTSGTASGKVTAQETTKRKTAPPAKYQEFLMMPPGRPAKM